MTSTALNDCPKRVAVLGAGISGLTAAYALVRSMPGIELMVFDAEARPGGVLQTERLDGWILDYAADNFIVEPDAAFKLCEELGLADQLMAPAADDRRALIVHRGRLCATPEGLALMRPTRLRAVLATPLLSWRAKARLMLEPFCARRKDSSDESLASFVRRRLGNEFLERIVQPLIAGIYTGNAETLSVQATVPQVVEMERKHGSLLRATLAARRSASKDAASRNASGARYGQFRALARGTHQLVEALTATLPEGSLCMGKRIVSISSDARSESSETGTIDPARIRWRVGTDDGGCATFDGVISALPGPIAAKLLKDPLPNVAEELQAIPYASSAIAILAIRQSDLPRPLEGFGFVVPAAEGRNIISVSYASKKYPNRAPEGMHLLRVFMGGAMRPDLIEKDDRELIAIAEREVRELLGWSGEPAFTRLVRWNQRMPQYHVGHLERVARIRESLRPTPTLRLIGNALDGVGMPQCVRTAQREAAELAAILR